jgi:hypothetical protein
MSFTIRRAEPIDYEAVRQVYAGPRRYGARCNYRSPQLNSGVKHLVEPP